MDRLARVAIVLFAASLAGSLLVLALGERRVAAFVVVPAAILSALAFAGHLVTLDDDARGGWSNPDGDRRIWRDSLRELVVKLVAFVVLCTFAVWLLLGTQ